MVKLIARTPCHGLLPITVGNLELSEVLFERITSIMPFHAQEGRVSDALTSAIGAGFPAPGRSARSQEARVVWTGAGQVMVLGPPVALEGAALSDQSDGWACLALEGATAREVLARLVPVDLRASAFDIGHVARTLLGHMNCILTKPEENHFEIMVFRSMAATAVHEIEVAMKSVVAQG